MEAEFYLYGQLTDAGGKNKVNIHLDTEEHGTLIIDAKKEFLKDQDENILYKEYGVRAKGMQNLATGEIDKSSLVLESIIDYNPKYDESYLQKLITKAKDTWKGIDADKWLNDLRGGYESQCSLRHKFFKTKKPIIDRLFCFKILSVQVHLQCLRSRLMS